MTIEEFKLGAHAPAFKTFLEGVTGQAVLELLEDYARPSSKKMAEAKQQYGAAEDVKLQMSLNYVALEQRYEFINFLKGLAQAKQPQRAHAPVPELLDEEADPSILAARGLKIPDKIDYRKPIPALTPEPVAS